MVASSAAEHRQAAKHSSRGLVADTGKASDLVGLNCAQQGATGSEEWSVSNRLRIPFGVLFRTLCWQSDPRSFRTSFVFRAAYVLARLCESGPEHDLIPPWLALGTWPASPPLSPVSPSPNGYPP
jgi:hypothetical protein